MVVCQAVEERVDLAKIADEPGVGLGTVFSPYTLAPLALGGGAAFALGYSSVEGIALGTAVGALARAAQVILLESTVPFTRRRHTLLLPVSWELAFGAKVFQQQARCPHARRVHVKGNQGCATTSSVVIS